MGKPPEFFIATLCAFSFMLLQPDLEAASAEWDLNPVNSDWNTAENWSPDTVPNGPADTAMFGATNYPLVSLTENIRVAGIVFSNLAPSYTIHVNPATTLTISGLGITNDSGNEMLFMADVSSAEDVGVISFVSSASAGNVTLIGNGGLTGGSIRFADDSLGGTARVKVYFNGNLDISAHSASGLSIGSLEGTGKVFLGGNNLSVGSNNLSTVFSGDIQEGGIDGGAGGSLTKIGSGTLTFAGVAAFGGDLTVESGILEIANGGSVSDRFGYAGIMPGSNGTVIVEGPGSMWTNMYGVYVGYLGGTGTLEIRNGGSVSSGAGNVGNLDGANGTVLVDGPGSLWTDSSGVEVGGQNATGTLTITNGGKISSLDGTVEAEGVGIAEVDGVGSTWTNDGPFYVGDGGTGTVTIRNGGTVSDTEGFIGRVIGGSGVVVVDGIGSTWTNSVRLEVAEFGSGMLVIQNGGAVFSADGAIAFYPGSAGTVVVNGIGSSWNSESLAVGAYGTVTIENAGTISSEGAFIFGLALVDGPGSIWQSGVSVGFTTTAVLTIQNGGSVSGDGGEIGSLDGYDGIVNVDGAGSTWINSFGLTIGFFGDGTLNIANGGLVSNTDAAIAARPGSTGTVNVDGTGSAWINRGNLLVGGGDFGEGGSALLRITGGGTVSTATTTIFADGTVMNDASLISPVVSVLEGGILGGSGTVFGNVSNAGTVSPGGSPGTLNLSGNYTQADTGILQIEIGGVSPGAHDLFAIGGSAVLGGTLQLVQLNNFLPRSGDSVTFLTARQGIDGTFAVLEGDFSNATLLRAEVVYQPNDVLIQFVQESFAGLPGLTPNQEAVAEMLDRVVNDPNASALIEFLDSQSLAGLPADYDRIAPEELTALFEIGISSANLQGSNIENRLEEIRRGASGFSSRLAITDAQGTRQVSPNSSKESVSDSDRKSVIERALAPPSPESPWGFFVSGSGQFVNLSGDLNAQGYDFQTGGITIGLDYRLSETFALGLTAGYAHTGAELADAGSIVVNNGKLGLYGTWFSNGAYVNGLVEGGYGSYQSERSALLGFARGDTVGGELNALLSGGYDLKCGNWIIGPTAAAQYTLVGMSGFTESGSLAPLSVPSQNADAFSTLLGGRVAGHWQKNSLVVWPEIRAGWKHDFLDQSLAIDSSLAGVAGSSFTVRGPGRGRNSAVLSAGLNLQFSSRFQVSMNYVAEVGRENYVQQNITSGVGISF